MCKFMTFNELHQQELENSYIDRNHNIAITLIISIYFIVLLFMMFLQGNVSFLDTFMNSIIAGSCIYSSYKLKEKSLNKTITNRVISKFKKELNIENESDIDNLYKNIKLDVLQGIGYIFTYNDLRYIYTSLDNSIKKYVLE